MKPHGLKGLVTVSAEPDADLLWAELKLLYVEDQEALIPYFIESVSERPNNLVIKFEDISSVEEASKLKNHSLFLPKKDRPRRAAGDFYDDEIIGFEVIDTAKGKLGKVEAIERAGSIRFIIVLYGKKEVMIPAQPPLVQSINKSKKKITVNLPEGFLDI